MPDVNAVARDYYTFHFWKVANLLTRPDRETPLKAGDFLDLKYILNEAKKAKVNPLVIPGFPEEKISELREEIAIQVLDGYIASPNSARMSSESGFLYDQFVNLDIPVKHVSPRLKEKLEFVRSRLIPRISDTCDRILKGLDPGT